MPGLIFMGMTAAMIVGLHIYRSGKRRLQPPADQYWKNLARLLQMSYQPAEWGCRFERPRLWVAISSTGAANLWRLEIRAPVDSRIDLSMQPATALDLEDDFLTGDPALDRTCRIHSATPGMAVIYLSEDRRERCLGLIRTHGAVLKNTRWILNLSTEALQNVDFAAALIQEAADLLPNFPAAFDQTFHLRDRFESDSGVGVRLRCLQMLLRNFLQSKPARAVAKKAAAELEPILALQAALFDPKSDWRSLLRQVASREDYPFLWLQSVLDDIDPKTPLAEAAVRVCLTSESLDMRLAAIGPLRRWGTAESVPALSAMLQSRTTSRAEKVAAEKAIAQIQSRLDPEGKGTVALAEEKQEGGVSLSQDDGAVSLDPSDAES